MSVKAIMINGPEICYTGWPTEQYPAPVKYEGGVVPGYVYFPIGRMKVGTSEWVKFLRFNHDDPPAAAILYMPRYATNYNVAAKSMFATAISLFDWQTYARPGDVDVMVTTMGGTIHEAEDGSANPLAALPRVPAGTLLHVRRKIEDSDKFVQVAVIGDDKMEYLGWFDTWRPLSAEEVFINGEPYDKFVLFEGSWNDLPWLDPATGKPFVTIPPAPTTGGTTGSTSSTTGSPMGTAVSTETVQIQITLNVGNPKLPALLEALKSIL